MINIEASLLKPTLLIDAHIYIVSLFAVAALLSNGAGFHITVSENSNKMRAHTNILKEKEEPTKERERWEVPCIDLGVS